MALIGVKIAAAKLVNKACSTSVVIENVPSVASLGGSMTKEMISPTKPMTNPMNPRIRPNTSDQPIKRSIEPDRMRQLRRSAWIAGRRSTMSTKTAKANLMVMNATATIAATNTTRPMKTTGPPVIPRLGRTASSGTPIPNRASARVIAPRTM